MIVCKQGDGTLPRRVMQRELSASPVRQVDKTRATPSGSAYLFGDVAMVPPYSSQLHGPSTTPWCRGWWQFALVIIVDAMVAWLPVTKQGRYRCHSGVVGGS